MRLWSVCTWSFCMINLLSYLDFYEISFSVKLFICESQRSYHSICVYIVFVSSKNVLWSRFWPKWFIRVDRFTGQWLTVSTMIAEHYYRWTSIWLSNKRVPKFYGHRNCPLLLCDCWLWEKKIIDCYFSVCSSATDCCSRWAVYSCQSETRWQLAQAKEG